jgi:hypothetical protein
MTMGNLAKVTLSDVRDTINVGVADIPDVKLQKMVNRAATTLSLELNKQVNASECSEAEKEFITLLAAIYCICYLTGGSAVGLNFTVGDQTVSTAGNTPPLAVLQTELNRILSALKKPTVRSA